MSVHSASGSEFSRASSYSIDLPLHGTTLTQADLHKPDTAALNGTTFVSTLHGDTSKEGTHLTTNGAREVHFADAIIERSISGSGNRSRTTESSPAKKTKLGPLDLKARLYDKPQHCQAITVIRKQEALKKQSQQSEQPSTDAIPRPPSGKSKVPSTAFRTTMFKKDYQRRQAQLQRPSDMKGPLPHLNRFPASHDVLPQISPRNEEIVDDVSEYSFGGSSGRSSVEVEVRVFDRKEVKFESTGDSPQSDAVTPEIVVSAATEDKTSPAYEPSPDELASPWIPPERLQRAAEAWEARGAELGNIDPTLSAMKDGLEGPDSDEQMEVVLESHDESPRRLKSAAYGTNKKDPSLVLTYLKKNIYDDTGKIAKQKKILRYHPVPENDKFEEVILEMRAALNWNAELPRHGPGCREKMEASKDVPDLLDGIGAAVLTKPDDGQFVYALPRNRRDNRARYNPYDLEVVSPHLARKEKLYYTGSASSVTRFQIIDGKEITTRTPVMWWLWEKRLFDMVFHLPVLAKFRRWKQFKVWRINVQEQKQGAGKSLLQKTLFTGNEVLQGSLLHIRSLCEAASGSLAGIGEGEDAITLVKLNKLTVITLPEFISRQAEQGSTALVKLKALREKVVDIVWEACATVAEMEGISHGIRPQSKTVKIRDKKGNVIGEEKKLKYKIKTRYGLIPVYEKKEENKSNKPSYAQIAEWRKILHRLSFFLRLVDFLLLDLLRRLVVTATKQLLKFIGTSYQTGIMEDDEKPEKPDEMKELRLKYPHVYGVGSFDDQMSELSDMFDTPSPTKYGKYDSALTSKKTTSTAPVLSEDRGPVQYDFEKMVEEEKPPDIDAVLEEIEKQNEVIEVPEPVFSLQLVLNLPPLKGNLSSKHKKDKGKHVRIKEGKSTPGSDSKTRSTTSSRRSLTDMKKKFNRDEDISEDGESEYDEEDSYSESEDESDQGKNRFAYSDQDAGYSRRNISIDTLLKLNKAHIVLSPSMDEVKFGFKDIVAGFELTVGKVKSMLKEPKLEVFYSPPKNDLKLNYDDEVLKLEEDEQDIKQWPDTEQLFGDDPAYQSVIAELMEHIDTAMDMVTDYSMDFDKYCEMVDRARKVDVDESMNKQMWTTEEFQHVLSIHTEQVSSMAAMVRQRRLGIVDVRSKGFCESCLPFPKDVLKKVTSQLPVIAYRRNEDLLTIIKGASRRLDKYPENVEEFVDHLSFLGKMTSEMSALEKEFDIVTKLYTISKDFEVDIEPEELALYQTLAPSFQHLKSIILYAEAKKEDNIRKFSSDLDKLIHDTRFKIIDIKSRVRDPLLLHSDTMASTALEVINILTEEVTELSTKTRSYASYQERFGSSLSATKKYSEEFLLMDKGSDNSAQEIQQDLSEIERDITLRRLLWESQEEWDKLATEWTGTAFDSLNVDNLQKNVNRFTQTVYMLEKGLPHNEVIPRLKEKVMNFKGVMPCITSLRNPSLRSRHWEQIEKIIGKAIERDRNFTLGNLLEMNIMKHKEKMQDISTTASNEATLERMLQKVVDLWQSTDFRLYQHSTAQVMIIAGADDILAQLEESQVTVGTIRGSRYVGPIKSQVEEWERKLQVFARTLDEWMTCQRNWLYLEQIFTTPDIQRQLPSESKLFAGVDKTWKDIMRRTEDRPNALKSATASGVLEALQSANNSLEKIQKCLEDYLETKRLVFPRFYFLSNDELLDILAQSKNPDAVQPHLGKCFGNIKSLDIIQLPRQPPTVKLMKSDEGEVVSMPKNVRARGPVEQWLGSVEMGMFDTVKRHLRLGLADWPSMKQDDWVQKHPGQVVLTVSQVLFNKDVVSCFNHEHPIKHLAKLRDKKISGLNMLARLVSTNLSPPKRLSINALLTVDVHNRDIIVSMIENKIARKDDFEWTRQLRYEWEEQSNQCNVLQSNASFIYGYEYLGCSPRLVITPLTDRCNLTLTGALHLHLGGSPAGPAGTGKTETVKDLSKSMGKQCVVFNCSEGLDFKMLGKFFSGLAQSGSWCCFDEFNRIDVEVLSVVAQQIMTIKTAKDQLAPRFVFEGRDIKLNMTCGIFITMNPTYAGRVDLPDNLKSLFRQVAMMVPDYALIAEIILFSEGFTAAKSLSTKIVNLYQLASKQLSQQDHYDFGMRAIKSVLVMAGQRKRQVMISEGKKEIDPNEEAYILIHALRDANMPKFLAEDVPLFESIMADLFPGMKPPDPDYGALEKAIIMSTRDQGLQHWPSQIDKVKQLHNQILVRHGVMLVGPTGGGKTTIRNILQRALVLLPSISLDDLEAISSRNKDPRKISIFAQHQKPKKGHVEQFVVNPKCVKLGELYGETDPNTFEWSDGLIASATRRLAKESGGLPTVNVDDPTRPVSASTISQSAISHNQHGTVSTMSTHSQSGTGGPGSDHGTSRTDMSDETSGAAPPDLQNLEQVPTDWRWIILDGPVDTIWIENLNTVLDDSKILCLANGERISLTSGMRLLFEVDDLSQASPATISRCAMVYMDPVDLGWKPYVRTWVQRLPRDIPDSGKQHLLALFEHSVEKGLEFVRQNYKHQTIPAPEMSMVACLCHILYAFIDFMSKNGGFGTADKEPERPASRESDHSNKSSRPGSRQKRKRAPRRKKDEANPGPEKSKHNHQGEKMYYMQRNPHNLPILFGKLFVFAYTWSFGGNLQRQDDMDDDGGLTRLKGERKEIVQVVDIASDFDNFVREVFEVEPPLGVRLPASHRNMFGYFLDMESGNFVAWDALIPSTQSLIEKGAVITIGETMGVSGEGQQKSSADEGDIVPTIDTVRYSFLSSLLLLNKNAVLFTGESGVGKSAIIKYLLKRLGKDGGTSYKQGTLLGSVFNFTDKNQALLSNISSLTKLNNEDEGGGGNMDLVMGTQTKIRAPPGVTSSLLQFSAQTSADRTIQALTHRLIKKGRDTLGAPKGKKVIVFVDDLNMPAPEQYGAQPPLELLRQYLDLGGFYDMKKLSWKDILDVTLISACGPPGGGRNPVSPRLLKHFCMLSIPQPSARSLQHIYQVQLGRFFEDSDFTPEVKDCLFPLVSASIHMYYGMCKVMRPTPAKSHYTFNVRDLSQVVSGLMQANEHVILNSDNCAQLYAHEATRVFHDRLVDAADRRTFYELLADNLHDYFKVKWTAEDMHESPILFGDFMDIDSDSLARQYKPISDRMKKLGQILEEFYMRQNMGNTQAPQMVFFKDAVEHIIRAARVFRQPGGHMLLVGLDGTGKSTTVQLACFIADCELFKLTLTRGYSMEHFRDDLKKVCVRSGVKGINTVFLLTDSDIVQESFLEDINCILNSGEVPDLFDNEETDGIAMELKTAASREAIPDTRQAVFAFFIQRVKKNLHIVLAMSQAGNKFRQRCRMNPALINCCTIDWFDEWDREAMLSVARVYFQGASFVAEKEEDIPELKEKVAVICANMHDSVDLITKHFYEEMRRHFYVTPSSYMELIRLYSQMLRDQKNKLTDGRDRLTAGLSRLSEAESLVGTMQEELGTLGPKIEEKAKDTEVLLAQLEIDQGAVDQVREIVEAEEAVMKRETQIVQDYADECQQDLASVIPALQSAIDSLNTLNKKDISEVRVYLRPPALVNLVMSAVCTLFQMKPDWATAKQLLGDPLFLTKMFDFDKNSVPEKTFYKLKKYTKHADFNPDAVGLVSLACMSMCKWVLALEHYHEVYKMAKPKQRKVEDAQEALQMARDSLAKKQASLQKIQDHLKDLQQQYTDSVNQREGLKERKELTKLRLSRASVLIGALSDEKVRWAEGVADLDFKLKGLVGDVLVSAGAVAYLGAFNTKYRNELISQWLTLCNDSAIPIALDYEFTKSMSDPTQILRWQTEGLPQDSHSTENAIIVKKGRRWPLLIDPQGQASKWIREMEGIKLKVVLANAPSLMRTMEQAIRVGEAVLIQEVTEHLDPALKPILQQEVSIKGGHLVIKLGDTEIEYNDNFRLYLATNMSNPHYLPSVCIQVTLINFTVTFDGLQEQLLSSVVRQERPQLENERSQLLESIANDQQMQRDLEDKSLSLLQKSQGHILDDQDLVETLQKSKGMAAEIMKRIVQSEETEKKLNLARQRYMPVATRGAVLYFNLADLSTVDVMYQFSLEWFQTMFTYCIAQDDDYDDSRSTTRLSGRLRPRSARSSPELIKTKKATTSKTKVDDNAISDPKQLLLHMQKMIDRLTWSIYRVVSVALFANHQLTFSFMLCSSIMRGNATFNREDSHGVIEELEWTFFLQGNVVASLMSAESREEHDGLSPMQKLEYQGKPPPPKPWWMTQMMWQQCQYLSATFPDFEMLCRSIINCPKQWVVMVNDTDPYKLFSEAFDVAEHIEGTPPAEMVVFHWEKISNFQRIMLIKVLKPSKLTASCRTFIEEQMGPKFVSAGAADLKEMFDTAHAKTPLIFVLSPGSDPLAQLMRFAKELRGSALHVDVISLGRGQGPKAEELISKAQILKGRWIFLQNCHLAASWMPRLQNIVEGFNKPGADVDPQFRLWLSSKPDPCFPISILQMGLKMTVEPPQGVKANLMRTLGSGGSGAVSERMYEETCPDKPAWKNLVFGLCFFNAAVHERKKYGRLGWNIPYEFNDSDLEVSLLQLQMLLTEQDEIPWPALWYLTGEVTFGGRVTDDWDRRCLHSLMQKFYNPSALEDDYSFSSSQVYHPLSMDSTFMDVVTYIEELPSQDDPDLFGMDVNAEEAYLVSQADDMVSTILSVQPRVSSRLVGAGKSSDELVLEMTAQMLQQIPQQVEEEDEEEEAGSTARIPKMSLADVVKVASGGDIKKIKKKLKISEHQSKKKDVIPFDEGAAIKEIKTMSQSALFTVLRQEIDRFNNLLRIIHKSLKSLILAVKGEVVMSETLEEAYNAFLSQKVPAQWKNASYESCKPLGPWVHDLVLRVQFFQLWCDLVVTVSEKHLRPPSLQQQVKAATSLSAVSEEESIHSMSSEKADMVDPNCYWLSGFFFPQGFLTAVLQNHARKLGVSVDSLSFDFEVQTKSDVTEESLIDIKQKINIKEDGFKCRSPPDDGVVIFGLYIDGARWDVERHTLGDSIPGQRFYKLPNVHFKPVVQGDGTRPSTATTLESPLAMFKTNAVMGDINHLYEAPLYRTSTRAGTLSSTGHSTNFVSTVMLPSKQYQEFWVMRGVALLCGLDD